MEPIIKTEGVSREFRVGGSTVYALNNVTIAIIPETFTILQGPSGSGKTTLINLMGALDEPTRGDIFIQDQNITHLTDNQRDRIRREQMGFVFQSIALISLMSAMENVEFALRISGFDPKNREKRAIECLSFVGLTKRIKHRPNELSGGEQQRVAIARAIAHKPKIIFADEPTAELDTHTGLQVVKVFKTLVAEEGITVVMSSHDPNLIELADHVFSLEDGEIKNAE